MGPRSVRIVAPRRGFLTHSFEFALGALFPVLGLGIIATGLTVGEEALPQWLVLLWGACLLAGGPLMWVGLLWKGEDVIARGVESAGLCLAGSAWLTYGVTLVAEGGSPKDVLTGALVALGCAGRAVALARVTRAEERLAATATAEGEVE